MMETMQEFSERVMRNTREMLGVDLGQFGGFLRCETCHRIEPLGDTADHVSNGWPKCCGYTMRWWTQRQIDAGEVPTEGA